MARSEEKAAPRGSTGNPLDTESFLASLPELDAAMAAHRLRERLDAIAAFQAPVETKFSALAALGDRVTSVAASLAGRYIVLSLPISARILEELDSIRQLHQAHARAWAGVVHDLPEKGAQQLPRRQRELQGKARIRALQAMTEVLLSSIRYYLDPPKGLWLDIHRTFWPGVYPDAVGRPKHADEVAAETAYVRALLLGLCGTGQLPYRAIDRVAAALGKEWKLGSLIASHAAFSEPGQHGGRFLIDPTVDRPATPCLPGIKARPSDQVLNTEPLVTQIRSRFEERVQELGRGAATGRLPPDYGELELLRTLIGKWGGAAVRKHRRSPVQDAGKIVGGLSRIHQAFSTGHHDDPGAEIVLSASEMLKNSFRPTNPPPAASVPWMDIVLEDRSDEGMRFRVKGQTGAFLTVGDLVCNGGEERISGADIGVVVRARALGANEVEFGVRRLGTAIDTAFLHLIGKDTTPGDLDNLGTPFRSLVLERTSARPELLVADKGLYRPGATLWATWGGDTRIVRAGALFLSTRNFDAFAYTSTVSAVAQEGLFTKPIKRSPGTGGTQDPVV